MSNSISSGTPQGAAHHRFRLPPSQPQLISKIPKILPHERVFPIQIGSELFKLSGASISSDAPSYFSQYFLCQIKRAEQSGEDLSTAIRTLYLDRDPDTFKDISLHLQGYHVQPRDGKHFVRLFADAQFYTLPKLMSQLYEESIFMSIGHREFQIPRDLFSTPGNSPNFFSLGFAIFFSSPDEVFPGLERDSLIRPPSILPPSVPNRSADIFAELLHLLRGYPVHIRDDEHRQSLLRDCRYFNFKGLEQKLVPHHISYNQLRQRHEIVLRLEDILKSGITVLGDSSGDRWSGWVNYARPFEDNQAYELVLEVGGENTKLHFSLMRAEFFGQVKARVAKLFEVIATKLNLPSTNQPLGLLMATGGASSQPPTPGNSSLSEDLVRIVIEPETHIILDGKPYTNHIEPEEAPPLFSTTSSTGNGGGQDSPSSSVGSFGPSRKKRRIDSAATGHSHEEWIVRKGQWRLRIQSSKGGKSAVECVLVAVKLDAHSTEYARNADRGFLNG
ncbi:BTB/POZ domain-containing protein [Pseudomassariella vexata]|uniref:BTB/POZ domain-containing protein n=1 Tax=Pseudomassariella vexata TaxID=1141098 RepID=A0A1Y2DLT2_9PEZI|nr:BTB/POZ domain-containing protein [Pseudomassariella vexata]ORY60096.1 BTB/POZ domain-containing protein [Pseudomassariella vexata]